MTLLFPPLSEMSRAEIHWGRQFEVSIITSARAWRKFAIAKSPAGPIAKFRRNGTLTRYAAVPSCAPLLPFDRRRFQAPRQLVYTCTYVPVATYRRKVSAACVTLVAREPRLRACECWHYVHERVPATGRTKDRDLTRPRLQLLLSFTHSSVVSREKCGDPLCATLCILPNSIYHWLHFFSVEKMKSMNIEVWRLIFLRRSWYIETSISNPQFYLCRYTKYWHCVLMGRNSCFVFMYLNVFCSSKREYRYCDSICRYIEMSFRCTRKYRFFLCAT